MPDTAARVSLREETTKKGAPMAVQVESRPRAAPPAEPEPTAPDTVDVPAAENEEETA